MKKVAMNVKVDEKVLNEFRSIVYKQSGLKRGTMTDAITEALIEYTKKYKRN